MGNNWKSKYYKKHGMNYEETKASIQKYNNPKDDDLYYSNLGITELDKKTFFYSTYLGLISDDNKEFKEVYRTFRGEQEELVIIGFTEPMSSLSTSTLEFVDKSNSSTTPILTIYHGVKQIEAEIPINCEPCDNLSSLIMTTLLDKSKNYQDRIDLVKEELIDNQHKKELQL